MTKYYREPAGETFPIIEEETLRLWSEESILDLLRERMRGGEPFVFCEGPPTANSHPHIGHALTRAVKDACLRYNVMNGRKIVPFIAGWDCHGLPVELEIERSLRLNSKADIEAFGVARFNQLCAESVIRYKADWERMSLRIGYWIDYEHAYMTMSRNYIESVWWSLKQLYERGLLVKAFQVVPYCSRCGTALSSHEVALGFRETEDHYAIVRFRLRGSNESILVYTAAPWALLGNVLLAVNREEDYAIVEFGSERLILAEGRRMAIIPDARVVSKLRGSELVGRQYEPLFRVRGADESQFRIVHSSEISSEEGTGAMQVAPAYGSADLEIGSENGAAVLDPIDDSGRFTEDVPELAGRFARESDPEIIKLLEQKGLLFKWGLLKHSYPFCWRCYTPLIYKPRDVWVVKASQVRERMLELNNEIRWVPESMRSGRFGNFLQEAKDWIVSRSRYWGTPLPIWRCPDGHELCVGSVGELREVSEGPLPDDLDLHKPTIDSLRIECPSCGKLMTREDFVLDMWYDSGCAPFAQYHYPFENIEEFDTHRSVDFISEDVEQTRGWFYTQHVLSTMLFDAPAFRSVLAMGYIHDESGKRMTAHAGNLVYPEELFESVGADATRLSLLSSPVWQSIRLSKENIRQSMVGTLTTLLNVYAFYASNANAYGYQGQKGPRPTHDLDIWILSRLHSTVIECRRGFDALELHDSVRALRSLVQDLSSWYVRRSRRRFWVESDPQDRFSAHCTLLECLMTLSKLMAPITPFFADWLYRNLKGPKASVHLEDYPEADMDALNENLERQMAFVRQAVEAGYLARHKVNMKLRQPLDELVVAANSDVAWVLRRYEKMISEELNVKRVEIIESRDRMVEYGVVPNLRTLGPRLKESASEVAQLMSKMDGHELAKQLKAKGKIRLGGFDLYEEDVIVSEREKSGYSHASVGEIHVYISLAMNQKLVLEGLSREVIRRIQHMRKEQNLAFEDLAQVEYKAHPDIVSAINAHRTHIMHEAHLSSITENSSIEGGRRWVVNKLPLELRLKPSHP